MRIIMVGQGAFGQKHLDAIAKIAGIEVVSLCGGSPDSTRDVAKARGIPHWTTDLAESLRQPGVEAAIIASPTPLHAAQGIQCLEAGKHVHIEIPIADNLQDALRLDKVQQKTRSEEHTSELQSH